MMFSEQGYVLDCCTEVEEIATSRTYMANKLESVGLVMVLEVWISASWKDVWYPSVSGILSSRVSEREVVGAVS